MTLRYAHLSPAHLRDAVEAIGAFEDANRRHLAATSGDAAEVVNGSKSFDESWWPQRDSNPCRGLESPNGTRTRAAALKERKGRFCGVLIGIRTHSPRFVKLNAGAGFLGVRAGRIGQ